MTKRKKNISKRLAKSIISKLLQENLKKMEFALGNDSLHKSISHNDIKSMYTDVQDLKSLVRLMSKKCRLLEKIDNNPQQDV